MELSSVLGLNSDLLRSFMLPFELKQVHSLLIKTNTPMSTLPLTRVGLVCALNPSFSYATKIFERVRKPDIDVWNSCLKIFAEGDSPQDAILLFYRLRQFGILPNDFTCSFVLKACLRLSDIINGRIMHGYVEKFGLQCNLILQNMIVHLYAVCGAMNDARLLFENMPVRDVVTWNIMISQSMKMGDVNGACDLFSQMPQRNLRSWTSIISGLVQCGKSKEAISVFMEMKKQGQSPNEVTLKEMLELGKQVKFLYICMSNIGSGILRKKPQNKTSLDIHTCCFESLGQHAMDQHFQVPNSLNLQNHKTEGCKRGARP
ncbi:hypothetical protein L6164_016933 [Bauhinia variegata]|uniref:Uncharacterized protein n=1 Tax=Bauhinia variegata TaxID=167791 RepID=A0ACB9N643_BAUVA|nr:hypothetical protein L6164_016933 [Bauhinia variegata]